ncbi:hypothetical protein [Silvimonas iriomotensis]|uniref:DUF4142 domain-containing protein n=1 Tax=Silvimonas iriomotensis TaxID=449662 RepID=A0ABQ2P6M3_9NEIS|nr:hypothetical protein [Silvimonas iriomotensis]GGP19267.1 hypothetical protein GCM10010970_09760 [Silvimonas iriomotensis]
MNKMMRVVAAVISAGAIFAPLSAHADTPGPHPYYLHALSDLRDARGYLDRIDSSQVQKDEVKALEEIDAAIGEMKHAAIDDGKDIHDHMPVDANLKHTDRFHKALELLNRAEQDVSHQESDPAAIELQARVLHHIHEAHHAVDRAINAALE